MVHMKKEQYANRVLDVNKCNHKVQPQSYKNKNNKIKYKHSTKTMSKYPYNITKYLEWLL